jgi:hypothetical protein
MTCARVDVGVAAGACGMVTYILIGLGVAAVVLLAGFTGGLPSAPPSPIENCGIAPKHELEPQAAGADGPVSAQTSISISDPSW